MTGGNDLASVARHRQSSPADRLNGVDPIGGAYRPPSAEEQASWNRVAAVRRDHVLSSEWGRQGRGDVQLVEHKVDDDAGQRHVKPDRKRHPGDSGVLLISTPERPGQGQGDQGDDRCGQDRMREQDRKVDGSDQAVASERHAADLRMID